MRTNSSFKLHVLGNRVIAVDLRGYGGSSKPTAVNQYDLGVLVSDIKELVETLGKLLIMYFMMMNDSLLDSCLVYRFLF